MGFSLSQGFSYLAFSLSSGVEMDTMQRVMLHECMPALCKTFGDEPHNGVSKLHQSLELCFATQNQSGVRELCVEETPQQLSIACDSAPAMPWNMPT